MKIKRLPITDNVMEVAHLVARILQIPLEEAIWAASAAEFPEAVEPPPRLAPEEKSLPLWRRALRVALRERLSRTLSQTAQRETLPPLLGTWRGLEVGEEEIEQAKRRLFKHAPLAQRKDSSP